MWEDTGGDFKWWDGGMFSSTFIFEKDFVCAFDHTVVYFGDLSAPSDYCFYVDGSGGEEEDYAPALVDVAFGGRVAYLGDHPFAPASRLFIEVYFITDTVYSVDLSSRTLAETTGISFVLRLAGGDTVSCPLYCSNSGVTGSDFVLAAQEWWPYANKAGLPAWDKDTGLPINGGPTG